MLGNPFSPYYARARRRGPANPLDFVAMNAVLYTPTSRRWVLTERAAPGRDRTSLCIGPSSMRWTNGTLVVELDERASPLPAKLTGRVVVHPQSAGAGSHALDHEGRHQWFPIAPRARVEVTLDEPRVSFCGTGYLDANVGVEPLEDAFDSWSWQRVHDRAKTTIAYRAKRLDGSQHALAIEAFDHGSRVVAPAETTPLRSSGWGVKRAAAARIGERIELVRTLEDTPFYCRSQLAHVQGEERAIGVHETLDLKRFSARWVQLLLPARMRRARQTG